MGRVQSLGCKGVGRSGLGAGSRHSCSLPLWAGAGPPLATTWDSVLEPSQQRAVAGHSCSPRPPNTVKHRGQAVHFLCPPPSEATREGSQERTRGAGTTHLVSPTPQGGQARANMVSISVRTPSWLTQPRCPRCPEQSLPGEAQRPDGCARESMSSWMLR